MIIITIIIIIVIIIINKNLGAKRRGLQVRALVITNPDNPTGTMMTRQQIIDVIQFTKVLLIAK
jgi:histidinol-phosphate/aromatic aminotransferase/cobyric acid decarboxylase-like protein